MKTGVKYKPRGHWKIWDNVKAELDMLIEKNNGEFPNHKFLRANYSGMIAAINEYHGGMSKVRIKMGYSPIVKPPGYWRNWNNVRRELEEIINQNNGEFPTKPFIEKTDIRLMSGIRYFGGMNAVREKMGYELIKRPNGHYKNWDIFKSELLEAIKINNGRFTTQNDLKRIGLHRLVAGIEYHGGMSSVKEKMGYEPDKKPMKYWQDFKNIEKEIKKVIKTIGKFPTQKDFKELSLSSIPAAIYKYHGSLTEVRQRMGYKLEKNPNGYYDDWNVFKKDMKKAIKKNKGKFPNKKRLVELEAGLITGVDKHGGLYKVREKMGYELKKAKKDHYKKWENVEKILKRIIKENNGKFPNSPYLGKNYRGIDNAIRNYFGGYNAVREKMGYQEKREVGHYKKWENVEKELKEVIEMNDGEFPSQNYLVKNGLSALIGGFRNFGGIYAVREKIGYNEKMRIKLAKELEGIVDRLVI